jgi:hypothetical protein
MQTLHPCYFLRYLQFEICFFILVLMHRHALVVNDPIYILTMRVLVECSIKPFFLKDKNYLKKE